MRKITKTAAAAAASLALGSSVSFASMTGAHAMAPAGGDDSSSSTSSTATQSALPATGGDTPVLRQGMRSDAVKDLQTKLTAAGFNVPATGYFGSMTRSAVLKYQGSHGIPTTGVVAELTWGSLNGNKPAGGGAPAPAPAAPSNGNAAVDFALAQIGDSYGYGGTGPSTWDCSGLTQAALKAAGKSIPRTSQAQASGGQQVSMSNIQPGDLVVYYSGASHIGIYIGDGQIVHASRPGKPVAKADVNSMPVNSVVRY